MKRADDIPAVCLRRSRLPLVLVLVAAGAAACAPAPGGDGPGFAVDSIRQEDMRADLFFLASDAMNGRAATTRDVAITTEFIKARFQRLGLTPGGPDGAYFQDFNLVSAALGDGDVGLELRFRYDNNTSNLLRRSDHWPFLQVGVPATFFHTGLHPDYHRFTDTPDLINYPKMEKIARLVYLTSWNLANDDGRPALDRDL